jgi:hypothetical protein
MSGHGGNLKALVDHYIREDGTDVKTFIHLNADGEGKHRIATEYEATELHEGLKALNGVGINHDADGMRPERVIPAWVLEKSIREGWGSKEWRAWANSPEGRSWGIEHNGKIKTL